MDSMKAYFELMNYREGLITYGRKVTLENPDRLSARELEALTEKILTELDNIDVSLGQPPHPMNFRPHGIDENRVQELWLDFLDWYEIIKGPGVSILNYVKENYSVQEYKNILCVGDGQCSHIGRKLAARGHNVVSVDPVARKEFSTKRDPKSGGKLHVVKGVFYKNSEDMINWADLIVGAKVPEFVEELIGIKKETVFNISNNAEMYNMRFRGVPITSSSVLEAEIRKCKGVITKKYDRYGDDEDPILIFVSRPIEKGEKEL